MLLVEREKLAISGGLGVALPTAQDLHVQGQNGDPIMQVANQAVRLQPFLGALFTPMIVVCAGLYAVRCGRIGQPSVDQHQWPRAA